MNNGSDNTAGSKLLLHNLQIVRKHYGHFAREVTIMQVGFERSEITLDIPHEGLVTKEGSKIIPFSPPTVSEAFLLVLTIVV